MGLADLFNGFVVQASQPSLMHDNYRKGSQLIKEESGHIRRDPSCGLCGVLFRLSEPCFALIGDKDGMVYVGNTLPFPYNNHFERYDFTIGGLPGWSHCQAGYQGHDKPPCDSAMLHTECFELFRRHCRHPRALDRLFRFAAWKKPWPRVPNLFLPEARTVPPFGGIKIMAQVYGLKQLYKIPIEVMFAIWNCSPEALLWRYALVIDIAQQLNSLEEHPPEEVVLADILSWDKYGTLVTSPGSDAGAQTLVRLDSRGIRSVERIATGSKLKYRQSHSQRYLVIRSSEPRVKALIMDGVMRLKFDPKHPDLLISDTPNIHILPIPRNPQSAVQQVLIEQFCTIDLAKVTGLTLFFAKGLRLVHIHDHTEERPLAQPPRELLTGNQLHELKWVYVPLPKRESVQSISRAYGPASAFSSNLSEEGSLGPNFIFETKLAGSVAIGLRSVEVDIRSKHVLAEQPDYLVFKKRSWSPRHFPPDEIYLVGSPNFQQHDVDNLAERLRQQSLIDGPEGTHHVHTYIPMRSLTSATVFTRRGENFCQGILFRYKNGAQRSIGQCRFGLDDSVTVTDPLFVQITILQRIRQVKHIQNGASFPTKDHGVRVQFRSTYSDSLADAGLQRLGTKWLRVREVAWKDINLEVVEEDQFPVPSQV